MFAIHYIYILYSLQIAAFNLHQQSWLIVHHMMAPWTCTVSFSGLTMTVRVT